VFSLLKTIVTLHVQINGNKSKQNTLLSSRRLVLVYIQVLGGSQLAPKRNHSMKMLAEHTCVRFVIPNTKQMESKMFDFPLPFNPVIALNVGSKPEITVRDA
jgi:hypothetical protein